MLIMNIEVYEEKHLKEHSQEQKTSRYLDNISQIIDRCIYLHIQRTRRQEISQHFLKTRGFFAINLLFFPFSNVQRSSTSPSSTIQFQTKCYRKPTFIKNKLDDDDDRNVTCLVFFSLFLEPYLYHP